MTHFCMLIEFGIVLVLVLVLVHCGRGPRAVNLTDYIGHRNIITLVLAHNLGFLGVPCGLYYKFCLLSAG